MSFYRLFRPLLWTMDAERAHRLVMRLMRYASDRPGLLNLLRRRYNPPETGRATDAGLAAAADVAGAAGAVGRTSLAVAIAGLRFPNCLGLAAGLDKDGEAVPALAALGFGFVEVGTVTPRPQPGNPGVRLWRLPAHQALINRMGFNNGGAPALARRLTAARPRVPVPIGVNIGKNRDTPADAATGDYVRCLEVVYPVADYVVVNVSSPNTPGLRGLQAAPVLAQLLAALTDAGARLQTQWGGSPRPIFVKVAPDLTTAELETIVTTCLEHGAAGIIATNTTVTRPGVRGPVADQPGGLSGAPLFPLSNRVVAALYRLAGGQLPIIGVGGIMSAADAYAKIKAGASLVQVYTGFVYGGPRFPVRLLRELAALLTRDGFQRIDQAVGVEADRWPDP